MRWLPYLIVLYVACSGGAYGLTFGHFQSVCPPWAAPANRRGDRRSALIAAVLGPIGLLIILFVVITDGEPLRWRVRPRV